VRKLWIFDVDGTLANNLHRIKHLTATTHKDWDVFFSEQHKDSPFDAVMDIMNTLHQTGHKVIVITARDERFREVTLSWLKEHAAFDFKNEDLYMRKGDDRTDDDQIKLEIVEKILKETPDYKVMGVFEDRHRVIDAWRNAGYYVFECNQERAEF
jgi:phosphoglycolate phosphatase-like HAD superfamily hydrolase